MKVRILLYKNGGQEPAWLLEGKPPSTRLGTTSPPSEVIVAICGYVVGGSAWAHYPRSVCVPAPARYRGGNRLLRGAFGAVELFRLVEPSGRVGHAEIKIGPVTVMLSDEYPEFGIRGPRSLGATSVSIHIHVSDVDQLFAKAVAAGATVVRPLQNLMASAPALSAIHSATSGYSAGIWRTLLQRRCSVGSPRCLLKVRQHVKGRGPIAPTVLFS